MSKTFQYDYEDEVNRYFCTKCECYLKKDEIDDERFGALLRCKKCSNTNIITFVKTKNGEKGLIRKYPKSLESSRDMLFDVTTENAHLVYRVEKDKTKTKIKTETLYRIILKDYGTITVAKGEWVNCIY